MAYNFRRHIGNSWESREVAGPNLSIGSGAGADLRLDDGSVSLNHASIRQENARFVIFDNQSLTGTYVNGERVQSRLLNNGDSISIGSFVIAVRPTDPAGSLSLEIKAIAPEIPVKSQPAERPHVDYASAYRLESHSFNKTLLTLLLIAVGVVVLAGVLVAGRTGTFRPGAVSGAHMLIANQCSQCHVPFRGTSQQNCESCHQGPEHHANQLNTPSCQSCHFEHRGTPRLVQVDNRQCVVCHGDLKTKPASPDSEGGSGGFAKRVTDFVDDHPEFSVSLTLESTVQRIRVNDAAGMARFQGAIKLNHLKHLEKILVGQERRLDCFDCHRPAQDGRLMAPITYEAHCSGCHDDELQLPNSNCRAPHGSVEDLDDYLKNRISETLCKPVSPQLPERRLIYTFSKPQPTMNLSAAARVLNAENHLFRTRDLRCRFCHELTFSEGDPLPKVEKSAIPGIWFRHARFEHKAHRLLDCVECHAGAEKSQKTADLLVPGKATCLLCHSKSERGGSVQEASAPTRCAACHVYHSMAKDDPWKFKKTLKDLGLTRRDAPR